jgi:hypothetical protein
VPSKIYPKSCCQQWSQSTTQGGETGVPATITIEPDPHVGSSGVIMLAQRTALARGKSSNSGTLSASLALAPRFPDRGALSRST